MRVEDLRKQLASLPAHAEVLIRAEMRWSTAMNVFEVQGVEFDCGCTEEFRCIIDCGLDEGDA
jgi:hypothetical protein